MSQTTTSTDGSYDFTNLASGNYLVKIVLPPGWVPDSTGLGNDFNPTTGFSSLISYTAGDTDTADSGAWQPGSFTGVVFTDTAGTGVMPSQTTDVAGATIELLNAAGIQASDADGNLIAPITTGSTGAYSFNNLTPGAYIAQIITLPGADTLTTPFQADPATDSEFDPSNSNGTGLTMVTSGSTVVENAGVVTGPTTISGVAFVDANEDGVLNSGEGPFGGGVAVTLCDIFGNPVATTSTDGNGNYVFNVTGGQLYSLQFAAPAGYILTASDSVDVSTLAGQTATVNIGVIEAATLYGTVFQDDSLTESRNEGGVGGVSVLVTDSSGNVVGATTSAIDGTYLLPVLPGQDYNVQIPANDYTAQDYTAEPKTNTASETISMSVGQSYPFNVDFAQDALIDGIAPNLDAYVPGFDSVTLNDGSNNPGDQQMYVEGIYSFDAAPGQDSVSFTAPSPWVVTAGGVLGEPVAAGGLYNYYGQETLTPATFGGPYNVGYNIITGVPPLPSLYLPLTGTAGNNVSFTLNNAPAGIYASGGDDGTGLINWSSGALAVGYYSFNCIETWNDPSTGNPESATQQINVTVRDFQDPLASANDTASVTAGSTISFTAAAQDPNPNDGPISYILEGAPYGATISATSSNGSATFTWMTAEWQVGIADFNIIAVYSDGAFEIDPITINVRDFQNPLPGGLTVQAGSPVSFQASAYDPTGGAVSFSLDGTAPLGATIDPSSGDFAWGPTSSQAGANTFNVIATWTDDGTTSTSSQQVTINVYNQITLSGTVWLNTNSGSSYSSTADAGVPNRVVDLIDSNGDIVDFTTTNSMGAYSFTNVAPDSYTIQLDASYADLGTPLQVTGSSANSTGVVSTGAVTSGSTYPGLNFGFQPASSITGQVYFDNNGDASYGSGDAVDAGATLTFTDVNSSDPDPAVVSTVTTDANGMYTAALPAGTYNVTVSYATGYTEPWSQVTVAAGATASLNIGLLPNAGAISGNVWFSGGNGNNVGEDSTDTVVVTDANGEPIASTALATNGNFSIQLPVGTYYLIVNNSSYTAPVTQVSVTAGGTVTPATASIGLLQNVATLSGRVYLDTNGDGTFDAGDTPQANDVIVVSSGTVAVTAVTDSMGNYLVSLPAGTYTVLSMAPNYTDPATPITLAADDSKAQDVPMQLNQIQTTVVNGTADSFSILNIAVSGGTATVTTTLPNDFQTGQQVQIVGTETSDDNVWQNITVTSPNTFTFSDSGAVKAVGGAVDEISWAIASASENSSNVVTITTTSQSGFYVGELVDITNIATAGYNGTYTITSTASDSFTYSVASSVTVLATDSSGGGMATAALAGPQRSMVDSIVFTFAQPVNLTAAALSIAVIVNNTITGSEVGVSQS